jgi:hypothetical protein
VGAQLVPCQPQKNERTRDVMREVCRLSPVVANYLRTGDFSE